jgi:cobalamin biosynthesis Mg chelatase CobN
MKKVFTLLSLLALTAVLFPSCGVNVVKRKHNKGYHIEFASRHKSQQNDGEELSLRQSPSGDIAPENETIRKEETTVASSTETAQPAETAARNEAAPSAEEVAVSSVATHSTAPKTHLNGKLVKAIADHTPMPKVLKQKVKSIQQGESSARGGGLSLFWIIILILLLLWAFGYWGHWIDGGLIHVLLVIALVLLILWLLGVI